MKQFKKLAHAVWRCKYHIVWCPKYRFRILKGEIGKSLREIIRQLCEWKKIEILEGNIQVDHIHLVLEIPPKYLVSETVGFLKGKSAIKIFDHNEATTRCFPFAGIAHSKGYGVNVFMIDGGSH